MRRWQGLMVTALAVALILAVTGCESDQSHEITATNSVGGDDYESFDFSQEYGGLTTTDEEEAFDDPYLLQLALQEEGEEVDDPLADDPEVRALENQTGDPDDPTRPRPRLTFLRIVWGMLPAPVNSVGQFDQGADILDWSGLLRVDRGMVVVRRVIRFERPLDYLVFPRLDRQTVAWFSHTGSHFDGLLVEIIERPQDLEPTVDVQPNMLHFVTGPFTQSFPVAELPELDEVYPVEPEGNGIHFCGFRLADINICPKGFLSGIWHAKSDSSGTFRGRWIGLGGRLQGFLRGGYGYSETGERVMVGKYVSRRGYFRGLFRGSWQPATEHPGHGRFHAAWINRAGTTEGELGGQYFHLPERPGGFFAGRWAANCDEEALNQVD